MKPRRFLQVLTTNSAWLYAGELLPRLAGLVLVPIWSARVDPAEYARWVLALTSAELVLELGGLGLASFLVKVWFRYRDERAARYAGMGMRLVLQSTAVLAGLMAAASPWLSVHLIGAGVRGDVFAWLGAYVVLAQLNNLAILQEGTAVRYGAYVRLGTMRWVLNISFLLYFLLRQRAGWYSWVWAWVAAEACMCPAALWYLRRVQWGWASRHLRRFALRFSLPMLFTNGLGWGQQRVGRYVLSGAGMGAGVGWYGVAQQMSRNYGALIRPAKLVVQQLLGHELEQDKHSPYFLEGFHAVAAVGLGIGFVAALFLGDLMKLIVAPSYWGAAVALPALIFAAYLQELYSLYNSLMFRYFKVWFQSVGTVVAFLTVTAASLLLLRWQGFLGVALAQVLGAAAMVGCAHAYAMRVAPRAFRFGEKMWWTLAAFLTASAAAVWSWPLSVKIAAAALGLGGLVWSYWRRRLVLFPAALAAASREWLSRTSSAEPLVSATAGGSEA